MWSAGSSLRVQGRGGADRRVVGANDPLPCLLASYGRQSEGYGLQGGRRRTKAARATVRIGPRPSAPSRSEGSGAARPYIIWSRRRPARLATWHGHPHPSRTQEFQPAVAGRGFCMMSLGDVYSP